METQIPQGIGESGRIKWKFHLTGKRGEGIPEGLSNPNKGLQVGKTIMIKGAVRPQGAWNPGAHMAGSGEDRGSGAGRWVDDRALT